MGTREHAGLAEVGGADGGRIRKAREHDVGGGRYVPRRGIEDHPGGLGAVGALRTHVVASHRIALRHEAPCHLAAHGAQPDEADPRPDGRHGQGVESAAADSACAWAALAFHIALA